MLATGRWLWARPVWLHVVVLAVILIVVLPLTRPGGSLISDEGAAVLQARVLDRTGSWLVHAPLATFDPADRADPLPYVDVGPKGRAPYAKHPLYPLLLLGASKLAGRNGYYLLSILGTVLAAAGAAALGRRLGVSRRASLWFAALATSLWFYAFVLQAHSLGAAGAVAAVAVAWSAFERPSVLRLVALFLLVAFTTALRSEGVFFAAGLAVAAIGVSLLAGHWKRAAFAVAAVAVAAAVAVRIGERAFYLRVLGSGAATTAPSANQGPLDAPIRGAYSTLFTPTNQGNPKLGVVLVLALALVAVGALLVRQRGRDRVAVGCLGAAVVLYAVWFVLGPSVPIEGLFIVFPAGWAALWSLSRVDVATPARRFVAIATVVFTAGVILTQYPGGGGPEWGGRFFVLILAVVAPLVVAILARVHRDSFQTRFTRAAVGVLAGVLTLVLLVGAVRTLREYHIKSKQLLAALDSAGREAGRPFGAGVDGRPVVVTTAPLIPQLLWEGYDRFRWLDPSNEDLAMYAQRLADGGAQRLILIPSDVTRDIAAVGPWYAEVNRPSAGPHTLPPNPVIVFQRR